MSVFSNDSSESSPTLTEDPILRLSRLRQQGHFGESTASSSFRDVSVRSSHQPNVSPVLASSSLHPGKSTDSDVSVSSDHTSSTSGSLASSNSNRTSQNGGRSLAPAADSFYPNPLSGNRKSSPIAGEEDPHKRNSPRPSTMPFSHALQPAIHSSLAEIAMNVFKLSALALFRSFLYFCY